MIHESALRDSYKNLKLRLKEKVTYFTVKSAFRCAQTTISKNQFFYKFLKADLAVVSVAFSPN